MTQIAVPGKLIPLSRQSLVGVAQADIDLLGAYEFYLLLVRRIFAGSQVGGELLWARLRTAGGAFRAGAADYEYGGANCVSSLGGGFFNSGGATHIRAGEIANNAAGSMSAGLIYVFSPHSAGLRTLVRSSMQVFSTNDAIYTESSGMVTTAEDNDALRLLSAAGATFSIESSLYAIVP